MGQQNAVHLGAGPAGLTAALELIRPIPTRSIALAASGKVGGIDPLWDINIEDAYHEEKRAA